MDTKSKYEEKLEELVNSEILYENTHDPLTDLLNNNALNKRLKSPKTIIDFTLAS